MNGLLPRFPRLPLFLAVLFLSLTYCKQPVKEVAPVPPRSSGPGYLGILYVPNSDGLRILRVFPESPARRAGLVVGDTITQVEGQPAVAISGFREKIRARREGDKIQMGILSVAGSRRTVVAVINEIPSGLETGN